MRYTSFVAAVALLAGTASLPAQQEGPQPTQVLVSAESKTAQRLTPAAVKLEVNGHPEQISSLTPLAPGNMQIAMLIDDGLRSSMGRQLGDMQNFVKGLPAGAEILIGYMQNGRIVPTQPFTTDHAAAAAKIRIPLASPGISASPYFAVSDFVKRWPSADRESVDLQPTPATGRKARIILMITNGVDPYNGSTSPMNQSSPYVQSAAADAARAGIPVYSIYYGDAGMRGNFSSFSGQGYLQQVAEASGGMSFYQGTWSPVSLTPFFKQFQRALTNTYVATFPASGKRDSASLKLSSDTKGLKLHAPTEIRPGTQIVGGATS